MNKEKMEKLITNIVTKQMNDEQKKRFIKLIAVWLITKEKRKKEMIINWLYNLEFEL